MNKHITTKSSNETLNHNQAPRYVITGGPGIGKTTVLDILSTLGHQIVPEAAREVIEAEQAVNGDALPWKDSNKFQEKVLELQLRYEGAASGQPVFCDRGIVDGHGYSTFFGGKAPEEIARLGRGRYSKVFVLDRLPTYQKDSARLEDEDTAIGIHLAVVDAYKNFGYDPILVPVLTPHERVDYVLARI